MPKISSYTGDTNFSMNDKLIGTDGDDGNATKTYPLSDLVEFIGNELAEVGAGIAEPEGDGLFARGMTGNEEDPVDPRGSWGALATNLGDITDSEVDALRALVFQDLIRGGSATPSYFEKGVATTVSFAYSITENDDVITEVIWDGTTTSEEPFPLTGTASDVDAVDSVSRLLEITTERGSNDLTISSAAYTPQWRGVTTEADISGAYATLNAELTKVVQSSDNQSAEFTSSAEYVVFISTNGSASITDGNGFSQSVGEWDDGTSEFYKKTIAVTLADASVESMTIYRTRQLKTATTTYNLS